MKRDPFVWFLLGLQVLLLWNFIQLDRSDEVKPNLRPIYWDVISYYAYLPALWIEGDLTLSFVEDSRRSDVHLHRHRYWPETTPRGHKVIKTTMGVALMMSPFFGMAHIVAPWMGYPGDGFSRPYQFAVALAGFFWGSLGLWVLRSWLRAFWGPWTVAVVLLLLVGATNLGNYLVYEPAISHSFSFFWMSMLLWCTHRAFLDVTIAPRWFLGTALALGVGFNPVDDVYGQSFAVVVRGMARFWGKAQETNVSTGFTICCFPDFYRSLPLAGFLLEICYRTMDFLFVSRRIFFLEGSPNT